MWRIQALPWSASATDAFFFLALTTAKTAGAIDLTLEPWSHLSIQKKVDSPFHRVKIVAA
jgi:hypothetical protein